MDVTCERCGTEYEFDETLLSGRGTSVKCTNCGHLFKVYPKAREDADRTTSTWRVLGSDGMVDTIDSLRELQRRIGSGELTPNDKIARGDEEFKRLGSIPELETFFQAADAEDEKGAPSPVPPGPTASTSDSSVPPGRRPRQPTLLGVVPVPGPVPAPVPPVTREAVAASSAPPPEVGNENVTVPVDVSEPVGPGGYATDSMRLPESESESGTAPANVSESLRLPDVGDESFRASAPGSGSLSLPESPRTSSRRDVEDAVLEEPPRSRDRSAPPAGYYDDDEDLPDLPGRGSTGRWLVLLALVGGVAFVALQWPRVSDMLGFGSSAKEAAAAIEDGHSALAADHLEAYERAVASYGRALEAGHDEDIDVLIGLAQAHALAAQALDDGARPDSKGLSREAHAKAAINYAEQALMIDAKALPSRLAEADALRLSGDLERAREALENARLMPFSRTAEFSRIDALLQAAEREGKLDAALVSAAQAAERAPNGIRYRLLRARAELASGATDRARTEIEAVLAIDPSHPTATALLADLEGLAVVIDAGTAVDGGAAVDAGAVAAADAGTETAADAGAAAETETVAVAEAETETVAEADTEAEKVPAGEESASVVGKAGSATGDGPQRARAAGARDARSRKRPVFDEYDRLAQAAGSDAFIDGRPPLRDFGWYMREGEAALAGRDYIKARALFESALEARPGSGDATDALGRVAFASEDYELSLRYFRSAAQRGHPDGYYNLGRGYERLGNTDKAISAYYTYLKRRPSGAHVATARAAIKKLDPRVKLPESSSEAKPETKPQQDPEPEKEPPRPAEPAQESEAAPP